MTDISSVRAEAGIGFLRIDAPPVNTLSHAVRRSLDDELRKLIADADLDAIVIICGGRTFFAGADIAEFGKPFEEPTHLAVFDLIEAAPKPVIAAIHGAALGGGLELALACHHRVAIPSAKVGFPEVHLGLLPGAGGTQRLPRLIGAAKALDLITSGKTIGAGQALQLGILDELTAETALAQDASAFARRIVAEGALRPRIRDREDLIAADRGKPEIFADFRAANARSFRGFRAPEAIVRAIEAAVEMPFDAGMRREAELFRELEGTIESAAQRHIFFAERETSKIPDIPADTPTLPIASVGVIGAGTMGGGIAMNFLNVGFPVTIAETSQDALDRGIAVIRRNYENTVAKGRMTAEQLAQRMAMLTPVLSLDSMADADLVIEAAFESMSLKKQIFSDLDRITKRDAILASNTSFLDIDVLAEVTSRPEFVVGLHFFSPANVMRLLEVVRGQRTSKQVVATVMRLAKTIGKTPVLARVCEGFIANRLMMPRMRQADTLVLEGPTPAEIDKAIYDYGFAMGPFQMIDLVGLDVIGRDSTEATLAGELVARGRLGQKQNGGYYDYDEKRRPRPSAVVAEAIAQFARSKGTTPGGARSDDQIIARLLYPVVNEGAKILEEGIALRASDIDIAAVLGYNWPAYRGGPMFWADTVGLPRIVAGLKALEAEHGVAFKPAALLERLATEGHGFTR